MAKVMRTALVQIEKNVHKIFREDEWNLQKIFVVMATKS